MAKTKSQRMKEYRARKKEQLGDEWLRRENQRVKSYFVPISALTEEKQMHKRQLNREHCKTYRKKQRSSVENRDAVADSVENQDAVADTVVERGENEAGSSTDHRNTPLTVKMNFHMSKESASRQSRGRKRVSRALAKQYRKNEKLLGENESLKRKLNTVRKKLKRLEHKQCAAPSTPRSKVNKLMKDAGIEPTKAPGIRQRMLFAECIGEEIHEATKANDPKVVATIVSGKVIKKYKLKATLGQSTNINRRKLNTMTKSVANIKKRTRNAILNNTITREIQEFLMRDDNSRLLPGKADAVKVGKSKVQKRVLNDYMYNLHTKFLAESTYKVSRATFYARKPQSIAHVNFSCRSVCLCQKHQNFALKLRCLKNYKVTAITSPDKFMESYGNEEQLDKIVDNIQATTIRYQEWRRKKMKDGKQKMRVVDIEVPKGEFKEMMKSTYRDFAEHIHKVIEQYKGVKQMKEKLPANHALIQMDFSENYCCQNMEEVQSAYWNSTAVTLHPTVIYKKNPNGTLEHRSIVFVSEVLQHNAAMVLAIIEKVIGITKMFVDDLKAIHFWTDSPTSQYRNKTVFHYLSQLENAHGITGSWQYFESGHGKGPCDGIGGTTKRNADNAVKQGKTIIQDADDFFKWARDTESQIEYVQIKEDEFNLSQEKVDKNNANIKPIKGTMKIHSVIGQSEGHVRTRVTTCVCDDCFGESGFKENSQCVWTSQSMVKPMKDVQDSSSDSNKRGSLADVEPEPFESTTSNDNDIQSKNINNLKENDFVVVVYNGDRYIGQITDLDEEDNEVEVNCMEECGKVQGRYKWPRNADKIWLNTKDVLMIIDDPKPTGRTKRIFSVEDSTQAFLVAK